MTTDATEQAQPAEPPRPKRALGIFAHPDDAEFLCGGTVAKLCAAGWEVRYIVATSGDKGTKDPALTPAMLANMREAEQSAAGAALGVKECLYLRHPDGFLEDGPALRGQIVRLLRRYRPDTVITWDGFRRGFNHRDHRNIGIATYDALFPAVRDPLYYPDDIADGMPHHRVGEILLAGSDQPDYFVDVADFIETKARAIYCHWSQIEQKPWEEFYKEYRERGEKGGREGGVPFTEAFRRVTMRT
ncbi:MAG TPA: PIG-L deacetylase family protein [Dehalococcoidia bacterium]|nr:PIG-L deacetylase family protein [Dehalococcoidia bacterium]